MHTCQSYRREMYTKKIYLEFKKMFGNNRKICYNTGNNEWVNPLFIFGK